jgi:hypothetical protein
MPMPTQIHRRTSWCLMEGGGLCYRNTKRQHGPKNGEPVYLYHWGGKPQGGRAPRWVRKIAKLKARGTYRRRDQWRIDKAHTAVIRAADSLAPHLNLSGDELLTRIGYIR